MFFFAHVKQNNISVKMFSSTRLLFGVLFLVTIGCLLYLVVVSMTCTNDRNQIEKLILDYQNQFDLQQIDEPAQLKLQGSGRVLAQGDTQIQPTQFTLRQLITVTDLPYKSEVDVETTLTPRSKTVFGPGLVVRGIPHIKSKQYQNLKDHYQFFVDCDFQTFPLGASIKISEVPGTCKLLLMLNTVNITIFVYWYQNEICFVIPEGIKGVVVTGQTTEPRHCYLDEILNGVVILVLDNCVYEYKNSKWSLVDTYFLGVEITHFACTVIEGVLWVAGSSNDHTVKVEGYDIVYKFSNPVQKLQWTGKNLLVTTESERVVIELETGNRRPQGTTEIGIVYGDEFGVPEQPIIFQQGTMKKVKIFDSSKNLSEFQLLQVGTTPYVFYIDGTTSKLCVVQSELPFGGGHWCSRELFSTESKVIISQQTNTITLCYQTNNEWFICKFPTCLANVNWKITQVLEI